MNADGCCSNIYSISTCGFQLCFITNKQYLCKQETKEPGHEETCLMLYANNKGVDQPAHPRSLMSVFIVRCLDSVTSLVSVTKILSLMLASVAEQASLSLTWSETPEDTFSHDEAQRLTRQCICLSLK